MHALFHEWMHLCSEKLQMHEIHIVLRLICSLYTYLNKKQTLKRLFPSLIDALI